MCTLRVRCDGDKWQDDWLAINSQVHRYYKKVFHGPRWRDKEEAVQEATCWFMEMFASKWRKGEEIVLQTVFAAHRVFQQVSWVRRSKGGCYKPKRRIINLDDWRNFRAENGQSASEIDLKDAIESLTRCQRFVVKKVLEGYSVRQIEQRWRITKTYTEHAVRRMLTLL